VLGESASLTALAFFIGYMACISGLEVVLMLIAIRDDLFVRPLTTMEKRNAVLSALSPVVASIIAVPACFIPGMNFYVVLAIYVVLSIVLGIIVRRVYAVPGWSRTRH
jgi:hypothetical protein